MIGSVALPVGIFWFAWTAAPNSIPWIVSILAGVPFGFGVGLVFLSGYILTASLIILLTLSHLLGITVHRAI
jgi:hypothetical protein